MRDLAEFLRWENLLFLAPFLLMVILSLILGFDHGADHDTDAHADIHPHLDTEVGHEVSAGAHSDLHHDSSHDSSADHAVNASLWTSVLGFVGIGRAPLNIVLACIGLLWLLVGLTLNQLLGFALIWINVAVTAGVSLWIGGMFARQIGKLIPSFESYSQSGFQLWAKEGKVIHTVSEEFGTVRVVDDHGQQHDLRARLKAGQAMLPPGTVVAIDDFDPEKNVYIVELVSEVPDQHR